MVYQFTFPDVGEGISEGILVKWKVKVGDTIKENDALGDVETAKALVEIPSPKSGTILQLHVNEGQKIHVGDVLVTIGAAGETVSVSKPAPAVAAPQQPKTAKEMPQKQPIQKPISSEIKALPAARKRAAELGIDLASLVPTGAGGVITLADVEQKRGIGKREQGTEQKTTAATAPTVSFDKWGRIMSVPLTGVRKAIADNMTLSKATIPHVTHIDEADVTELETLRQSKKEYAENKGIHLTLLPFIMKAAANSLKAFPYLNARFNQEKQAIEIREYYNFGFAVDTSYGLIVPVIKGADSKSVLEIAKKMDILATHARERDLPLEDMQGATFSFTNIGSYGGIAATPIIPPGQAVILGIYRMKEKPVVREGGIVIRKIMPLSLTFDHRVIDGATAAKFMNDLIKHLEDTQLFSIE